MTDKKLTSIFLIGMMASGKSTVGRRLAERLGWAFYDADREIEARCGVPISYIFEKEGEAGFRARETQMLAELTAKDRVVVATGGGAPMFEINRKIERTRFDSVRPLLAGDDRAARIRSIMLERGPVYDEVCNEKVITSRKPIDFVVEKILALESVREVTQHKLEGGEK